MSCCGNHLFFNQNSRQHCVIPVISNYDGHSPTRTNHYMAHSPHRLAIFILTLRGKPFHSRPLPPDRRGINLHHAFVARSHVSSRIFYFSGFPSF